MSTDNIIILSIVAFVVVAGLYTTFVSFDIRHALVIYMREGRLPVFIKGLYIKACFILMGMVFLACVALFFYILYVVGMLVIALITAMFS